MKLVVFTLSDKEYAIDVSQIREVIRTMAILPLPDVPQWIEGIINWRGDVIPIVSLRRKLGYDTQPKTRMNRVIIAHRKKRCFGILVDNVSGVVNLSRKNLSVPDDVLCESGTIHAVAKMEDRLIPLLDLYSLLSETDTAALKGVSQEQQAVPCGPTSSEPLMDSIEQG